MQSSDKTGTIKCVPRSKGEKEQVGLHPNKDELTLNFETNASRATQTGNGPARSETRLGACLSSYVRYNHSKEARSLK